MNSRDFAAGASASLNRSITDLMVLLGDCGPRPRRGLRPFYELKLTDYAEHMMQLGFMLAHFLRPGRAVMVQSHEDDCWYPAIVSAYRAAPFYVAVMYQGQFAGWTEGFNDLRRIALRQPAGE